MGKLLGVEAGRGAAALLVVLVHAGNMLAPPKYFGEVPLGGMFKFGHAGVDFFFVLSGFIIYHIHQKDIGDPQRMSKYWWRRLVRIFPVYWIVFLFWLSILAISPTHDRYEQSVQAVLTSFFLIPQQHDPILGVAWTLSHELLFYTLFSLSILHRRLGRLALAGWAILIVGHQLSGAGGHIPWVFALRIFDLDFFLGIFVVHALRRWDIRFPRLLLATGSVVFFTAGLIESWGPAFPPEWAPLHIAYGLGAAMALYGLAGAEIKGTLRVPALLSLLGSASYSTYLLHTVIIQILQQGIPILREFVPLSASVTFLALVAATLVLCVFFSKTVEQPLLRWGRQIYPGARPQVVSAEETPAS